MKSSFCCSDYFLAQWHKSDQYAIMWIKQLKSFSELTLSSWTAKLLLQGATSTFVFIITKCTILIKMIIWQDFFCSTHDNLSMSVFIILLSWKLLCRLPVHYLYMSLKHYFAWSEMPSNLSFCLCQNYFVIGRCFFFFLAFCTESFLKIANASIGLV